MKITLSQSEIEQAVVNYMQSMISIPDTKEFKCEFGVTRNPTGISAEIDIIDKTETEKESSPFIQPSEEIVAEEEEPQNNSVRSLFGNLGV